MKLVKYENLQVKVTDEAFMIKAIRDMYNADTSVNKEHFMQQISYIFHMVDPRSFFSRYPDDETRHNEIVLQEGLPKKFKPSKQLLAAMDIYKKVTKTASMQLLEDMRIAVQKTGEFLRNADLEAVNDKGTPKYSISSIVSATDKLPQLAKRLQETEKIVYSEIEEVGRARGGNDSMHVFEGGFRG